MKSQLQNAFTCRDLGEPKSFLSMQITRDRKNKKITIVQPKMVTEVLTVANMKAAKKVSVPMDPSVKYIQAGTALPPGNDYATILGKLIFLSVCTRPDISYAVNVLARFMQNPTDLHWKGLMQVCRYLFHTMDLGIVYGREAGLHMYTDAAYANCPATFKSTSGCVTILAGGAIDWFSKRQSITAQSSTEAEYIAASHAVRTADYMRKVVWSFNVQVAPWKIWCDNSGAIAQSKSINTTDKKMKHVAIKYHLVRDRVSRGEAEFKFIPGKQNVADCLTKATALPEHRMGLEGMGLVPCSWIS